MVSQLNRARQILDGQNLTCVLLAGEQIFTSDRRGVAPLLGWLEEGRVSPGFYAADKVVGRATAYLYCLLGAKAVYAGVISEAALEVLSRQGIETQWGQRVPFIRNRTGDGMCPMEEATASSATPEEALGAIREKLRQLQKG